MIILALQLLNGLGKDYKSMTFGIISFITLSAFQYWMRLRFSRTWYWCGSLIWKQDFSFWVDLVSSALLSAASFTASPIWRQIRLLYITAVALQWHVQQSGSTPMDTNGDFVVPISVLVILKAQFLRSRKKKNWKHGKCFEVTCVFTDMVIIGFSFDAHEDFWQYVQLPS